MALTDRSQLNWLQDARIGALNFASGVGSSAVVTSPITTVLSTAGDGGVSVPLRVFSATQSGVITTGSDNIVIIVNAATKRPIADSAGNEVYGKITESGAYTLSYFSLVAGVETVYTFASTVNIDFYFAYRFDAATLPKNALISIGSKLIQQDPSVNAGSTIKAEKLTVTALNTLSALTLGTPTSATNIFLIINNLTYNAFGGANAAFSVSGTAITWSAANAAFNIQTTFDVVAWYW